MDLEVYRLERVRINFLPHSNSADGFYFSHIRMDKFRSYSSHKLGLLHVIVYYLTVTASISIAVVIIL